MCVRAREKRKIHNDGEQFLSIFLRFYLAALLRCVAYQLKIYRKLRFLRFHAFDKCARIPYISGRCHCTAPIDAPSPKQLHSFEITVKWPQAARSIVFFLPAFIYLHDSAEMEDTEQTPVFIKSFTYVRVHACEDACVCVSVYVSVLVSSMFVH